ncbi:MAG: hypothetical protein Q9220_003548 [cf. Caloplaca sp. 1 TL-2023]
MRREPPHPLQHSLLLDYDPPANLASCADSVLLWHATSLNSSYVCGLLIEQVSMASSNPSAHREALGRLRPTPGQLQTSSADSRTQRFSWQETPLEAQRPTFQEFSSPTNSTIDESPISPRDGYQPFQSLPQAPASVQQPIEKPPVERTGSPYNLPTTGETHPAYFAPVADEPKRQHPEAAQPSSIAATNSEKTQEMAKSPQQYPTLNGHQNQSKGSAHVSKSDIDRSALVYNPSSLAGPNAALENHRPGQAAHPNATIEPEWKHGLCEVDTLCCIGLCCPCIIYGKTQYRITRKTQKQDPTNMLGYETCNGSCGLMALACGFQCELRNIVFYPEHDLQLIQGSSPPFNVRASGSYTTFTEALAPTV